MLHDVAGRASVRPGDEGDEVGLVLAVGHRAVGALDAADGDGRRRQLVLPGGAEGAERDAGEAVLGGLDGLRDGGDVGRAQVAAGEGGVEEDRLDLAEQGGRPCDGGPDPRAPRG